MKWLFLDNDGTLVDTEGLTIPHLLARIKVVTMGRVDVPLGTFFAKYHGLSGKHLLETMSRDCGVEIPYEPVYGNRIAEVQELFCTAKVRAAPYVAETLKALTGTRAFAIVSNEPPTRGLVALQNTAGGEGNIVLALTENRYFAALPDRRKPLPDVYLAAMAAVRASPQDCCTVEDSSAGVKAAVAAGITCYGYTGLCYPEQKDHIVHELKAAGAVAVFDDWRELPALLLCAA